MRKASFKCPHCSRPMPPHIFKFHMPKSHPEIPFEKEEVEAKVEANTKEIERLTLPTIGGGKGSQPPEVIPVIKVFDFGEIYPCGSCGEEYPAKIMPLHARQAHGV